MCTECESLTFESSPLTVAQRAALDTLDELGTCWRGLHALMPGNESLDESDRDAVAVLMGFLVHRYETASADFRRAAFATKPL